MVRHFEEELKQLKAKLQHMGSLVEGMIAGAVNALAKKDEDYAKTAYAQEEEVNRIQIEIDDRCLTLIALQQPAAIDLRFITSAMKINADLERMADQAINIVESSSRLFACPWCDPVIEKLTNMAERVNMMVRDSLQSFIDRNDALARGVLLRDDEVDRMKDSLFLELVENMASDPGNANRSLGFILIARNLERIGDHATNISEDVIFMVCGKDIRHHMEDIH
jgi:phosphate transport system protein